MQFIDFCAGIGGFRLGFEMAGHECIGFAEYDKFARKSYKAMYDTEGEWEKHDIREIKAEEIPRADCWLFGFPCQDISTAGKQAGVGGGNRADCSLQSCGFLKNATKKINPNSLSLKTLKTCCRLEEVLISHGYSLKWEKLGAIESNGKCSTQKISESPKIEKESSLLDILETDVPEKYFLSEAKSSMLLSKLPISAQEEIEEILVKEGVIPPKE